MTHKVAVIQLNAGADKNQNIRRALDLVKKAITAGARLILLPEMFSFRGEISSFETLRDVAEDIPGPSTVPLKQMAQEMKVTIVAGSVHEQTDENCKVYNTASVWGTRGELSAVYRKRNLFRADLPGQKFRESDWFLSGKEASVFNSEGLSIGLTICFDLRFPRVFEDYGRLGCHAICCLSAFTQETGKAHWMVLLRARAIENRCYILAANQWGTDDRGVRCYGHSAIIDPWGRVLVKASGNRTQIIYAELDKNEILRYYRILPSNAGNISAKP
jgi:deaminated glutathione amidase